MIEQIQNNPIYLWIVFIIACVGLVDKLLGSKLVAWIRKKIVEARQRRYSIIIDSVKEVKQDVKTLQTLVEENRVKELRYNITAFENAILNGKQMSLRSYDSIMEQINEWEVTYADRHNGQIKDTIAFIRAKEKELKNQKSKK